MSSTENPKVPIVPMVAIGAGVGIIGGGLYLVYRYFVAPGDTILNQYSFIVQDMVSEIKQFSEANEAQSPPIYGLTEGQKQIIEQKKQLLQAIEPEVQNVLNSRNLPFADWITEIVLGAIVIAGFYYIVLPVIREKIKSSTSKQVMQNMKSADFVSNLCLNVVSNAFAHIGKLNVASSIYNSMQNYYTMYSLPSLQAQISYYQSMAQSAVIGSWQYIVANQMINSINIEMSTLMGSFYSFWLPPLI